MPSFSDHTRVIVAGAVSVPLETAFPPTASTSRPRLGFCMVLSFMIRVAWWSPSEADRVFLADHGLQLLTADVRRQDRLLPPAHRRQHVGHLGAHLTDLCARLTGLSASLLRFSVELLDPLLQRLHQHQGRVGQRSEEHTSELQ